MDDLKNVFENYANASIEHNDIAKCGQCYMASIQAALAKKFLESKKTSSKDFKEMMAQVDVEWKKTSLFKRVQELRDSGLPLLEIAELLEAEDIYI